MAPLFCCSSANKSCYLLLHYSNGVSFLTIHSDIKTPEKRAKRSKERAKRKKLHWLLQVLVYLLHIIYLLYVTLHILLIKNPYK